MGKKRGLASRDGLLSFKAPFIAERKNWLHKGILEVGIIQNQKAKVAD